jgi:4-aminobutyrate aminotransferase/(S)-3-amino-2-methylpropionate transaminase
MPYNLPGKRSQEGWEADLKYVVTGRSSVAESVPLVIERGEGVYFWDADGNRYLDFSAGILTASTGHCHPHVIKRLQEQVPLLWHVYAFPTPQRARLCEMLTEHLPPQIDTFCFYTGGSETIEAATRACSSYRKAYLFASMTHGYHGRTLMSRSLGPSLLNKVYGPTVNVCHLPYPYCYRCPLKLQYPSCGLACIELADDLLQGSGHEPLAALVFEPIAGAGGVLVPPPGAWQRLTEICRKREMLIIADEVLTGVGRTGKFMAIEHFGVQPDVMTFGKGLGSGFPIMCLAGRRDIISSYPFGEVGEGGASTSYGGNPLGAAAALGTLEVMFAEHMIENAARLGEEIRARLTPWVEKYRVVGDVRGLGLLWGIELVTDKTSKEPYPAWGWEQIYHDCLNNGVRLVPNRICPPLNITSAQLHQGLDVIEATIHALEKKPA